MTLQPAFWDNQRELLARIISPRLAALAAAGITAAEQRYAGLGLYFDNAQAHRRAAEWAAQHTDELLRGLSATTEDGVGQVISNWISTPGLTVQDLRDALDPILANNAARADRIAVTETTRAVSEGDSIARLEVGGPTLLFAPPSHPNCRCQQVDRRLHGVWVVTWQTLRDELVCKRPIETPWGKIDGCRGMHNIVISDTEYAGKKYTDV